MDFSPLAPCSHGRRAVGTVVGIILFCAASGCGPDTNARHTKPSEPTVYKDWPFDQDEAHRRQRDTAEALGLPIEKDVDLGNGVMLRLVLIPAGRFVMGSPYRELGHNLGGLADETRHEVTITRPYYLGKYELTQEQWQAVMGDNPSECKGAGYPVEGVGWVDADAFCKRAAAKLGLPIRLPTEAQWEFACRAGTTKAFGESDEIEALNAAGWYGGNSGARLHRVGEKAPNRWGLYDMRGNVWEWCQDWAAPFSDAPVTDPQGPAQNEYEDRVLRGGCWRNAAGFCRSAARDFDEVEDRSVFVGFRVAMEAMPASIPPRGQGRGNREHQPSCPKCSHAR